LKEGIMSKTAGELNRREKKMPDKKSSFGDDETSIRNNTEERKYFEFWDLQKWVILQGRGGKEHEIRRGVRNLSSATNVKGNRRRTKAQQ